MLRFFAMIVVSSRLAFAACCRHGGADFRRLTTGLKAGVSILMLTGLLRNISPSGDGFLFSSKGGFSIVFLEFHSHKRSPARIWHPHPVQE